MESGGECRSGPALPTGDQAINYWVQAPLAVTSPVAGTYVIV
jgi:hypothetical protein